MNQGRNIRWWVIVASLCAFASCNSVRYLPANESLYLGSKITLKAERLTRKQKNKLRDELEDMTRPLPNKKVLGVRLKLFFYNIAGHPKKETSLLGGLKYKMGEPPVLLSEVNVEHNVKVLKSYLENRGFFQAEVTGDTAVKRRKARALYSAIAGPQYSIKQVIFEKDSSILAQAILKSAPNTFLKAGRPFDLGIIKAERDRIDIYLKENGFYYFNPEYLIIQVDSSVGNQKVNLYVKLKPVAPESARKIYSIRDIFIFTNYILRSGGGDTLKQNAEYYKGYFVLDKQHLYKPSLFEKTMLFKSRNIYQRSNHNLTLNRLITLGLFKFVKNRFETVPLIDSPQLNAYYYLTPLPKYSLRLEVLANTKSNNMTGSQISVSWRDRNTFKGGELLTLKALAGFETQYSGHLQGFNTYRWGFEAGISVPRFIVPFTNLNTRGAFVPKTNILLSYELLTKMKLYTLNSFRAEFGYIWKESLKKEHTLNPISITYVQPVNVTPLYMDSALRNPILQKAIQKQFILGSNYSYTYNALLGNGPQTGWYFSGAVDLSGNIAGLITGANVNKNKVYTIFNAAFSQYLKAEIEARYYLQTGTNSVLANRMDVGVGFPYGNSRALPFIKQFFIGGNNSIRAFRSRSVGPGTYLGTGAATGNFLVDQSGDIKVEMNTEYRAKLAGVVNGAIFIDAGNIWLYNKDSLQPGGQISSQFLRELAVGTGVGLRIDISFLVLRLDLGFPLRKPYLPDGKRWVINQIDFGSSRWRKDNLVLNLAIGYPF